MTVIVGVHGVGNYTPHNTAKDIGDTWTSALRNSFSGTVPDFECKVAYYAPVLRNPQTAQGPADDLDALDPQTRGMIRAWLGHLDLPNEQAQGRLAVPLRQALEWVALRYGLDQRLIRLFAGLFFREVGAYLDPTNDASRHAAQQEVIDTITMHKPRVVLAHSLGSVVTYEALHARPDLHIELLVTLGSPLAMPDVVYERITPSPRLGLPTKPPSVGTWINIADPGDVIAIPRPLSAHFAGVTSDLEPSIHLFDFHRVRNYLANPTTAAALLPYLT